MNAYSVDGVDVKTVDYASQWTFPLARLAEQVLPEGDPDRELIVAVDSAVERLFATVQALDLEVQA